MATYKKIDEIEFIDTFRFGFNSLLFPLFLSIQGWILSLYFGKMVGFFYVACSAFLLLIYSKFAPTNSKKHIELKEASKSVKP